MTTRREEARRLRRIRALNARDAAELRAEAARLREQAEAFTAAANKLSPRRRK